MLERRRRPKEMRMYKTPDRGASAPVPDFHGVVGLGQIDSYNRLTYVNSEAEAAKEALETMFGGRKAVSVLNQAWQRGESVLLGWKKSPPSGDMKAGPLKVISGGEMFVGDIEGDEDQIGPDISFSYPPGAKGVKLSPENLTTGLEEFKRWKRIEGNYEPTPGEIKKAMSEITEMLGHDLNVEDSVLKGYKGPFAFIVHAEPIDASVIEAKMRDLDREAEECRDHAGGSRIRTKNAEKIEAAIDDLDQGKRIGQWKINIMVGALNDRDLSRVTSSFAGAGMSDQTLLLNPGEHTYNTLREALADRTDAEAANNALIHEPEGPVFRPSTEEERADRRKKKELPDFRIDPNKPGFEISSAKVAELWTYPQHEHSGTRQIKRPRFDVDVEGPGRLPVDSIPEHRRLDLGVVFDNDDAIASRLIIDYNDLLRHWEVIGTTGSGKSELLRSLVEQLDKKGIKTTIIDPGGDYRVLGDRLINPVTVVRPGDNNSAPLSFNPFEPEPGFDMATHADYSMDLLLNAFGGQPGEDDRESADVSRRYLSDAFYGNDEKKFVGAWKARGWNLKLGRSLFKNGKPRHVTMRDIMEKVGEAVKVLDYQGDAADLSEALKSRIRGLRLGKKEHLYEGYGVSMPAMMERHTIIETDSIPDPVDQTLYISSYLVRQLERLKVQYGERKEGGDMDLQHVIVIDEAHRIFKKGPLADKIVDMIAEIRKYGVGIVFADQSTVNLSEHAQSNTNTKILMKVAEPKDKDTIGESMKLREDQKDFALDLLPGQMIFKGPHMDNAVFGSSEDPRAKGKRKDQVETSTEGLLMPQYGNEFYTLEEIALADEFLRFTSDGRALTAWADITTTMTLMGLGDTKPKDESPLARHFQKLREMGEVNPNESDPAIRTEQEQNRRIRNQAIKAIVENVVDARPIIFEKVSRDQMIDHLKSRLIAQIDNLGPIMDPIENYQLESFAYMQDKSAIYNHKKTVEEANKETNAPKIQRANAIGRERQEIMKRAQTDPEYAQSNTLKMQMLTKEFNRLAEEVSTPVPALSGVNPAIVGSTAAEQIAFINHVHGPIEDMLFPHYWTGPGLKSFVDHAMQDGMGEKIELDTDATLDAMSFNPNTDELATQRYKWLGKYKELLTSFDIPPEVVELYKQEAEQYILHDDHLRVAKRRRRTAA